MNRLVPILAIVLLLAGLVPVRPQIHLAHRHAVSPDNSATAFDPSAMPAIFLWFRADTNSVYKDNGVTLAASGDTVQYWQDKTGNGNNAIQATVGKRPTFLTNYLNGFPAVRVGTATATIMYLDATYAANTTNPVSVFCVMRFVKFHNPGFVYDGLAIHNRKALWGDVNSATNRVLFGNPNNGAAGLGFGPATNSWYFLTLIYNGTNSFGWQNQNLVFNDTATDLTGDSGLTAGLRIGATYIPDQPGFFDLVELLMTTNSVDLANRNAMWGYLTNRYSL